MAWNKLDKTETPSLQMMSDFVGNPLWDVLVQHLQDDYGAKPVVEYSGCSVPGWNAKFKKGGRNLCTLYPMEGYFTALVVIGQREKAAAEQALPLLTPAVQKIYHDTQEGMGQRWLMIDVRNDDALRDVRQLVAIRRGA